MNHSDHSYKDCPELNRGGWLDPTKDQIDNARSVLAGSFDDEQRLRWALDYIGACLKRVTAGDFDHNDLRRAIAMYRVYDEEASS